MRHALFNHDRDGLRRTLDIDGQRLLQIDGLWAGETGMFLAR